MAIYLYLIVPPCLVEHSHKKRKDSLETRAVLLIFLLERKYLGWPYKAYIKTAKNGNFC